MSPSERIRELTGSTTLAAVIGHPVRHSLSPVIMNAAFAELGVDWAFVAFDVAPGSAPDAIAAVRALGLGGLSVTMPHKDHVARLVDELTPRASAMSTANCVVVRADGSLLGDSTDGAGLVSSLTYDGVSVAGHSIAVIGAGGAARSIVAALADAGATVAVLARREEAASRAALVAPGRARVGTLDDLRASDIVINATPLGMAESPGFAVDPEFVRSDALAVDIVYHPIETAWMNALAARGVRTLGGLGMLVGQAAVAVELWTGHAAPHQTMRDAVSGHLRRTRPGGS